MNNKPTKLSLIIALLAFLTVVAKGIFDHSDQLFPTLKPVVSPAPSQSSPPQPDHPSSIPKNRREGVFQVSRRVDKGSNLTLEKVEITNRATVLRLRYVNDRMEDAQIRVFSPTSPYAFTIYSSDYAESFKLIEVFEIKTDEYVRVQPEQSITFSLRFERIPDNIKTFHLIEDKGAGIDNRIPWVFTDITLNQ
jgi:hypothetical protein